MQKVSKKLLKIMPGPPNVNTVQHNAEGAFKVVGIPPKLWMELTVAAADSSALHSLEVFNSGIAVAINTAFLIGVMVGYAEGTIEQ